MRPLSNAADVTVDWLRSVFGRSGEGTGEVRGLKLIQQVERDTALILHLAVRWDADASALLPRRLFLKIPNAGFPSIGAEKEVRFYRELELESAPLPVVRCFDAVFDRRSGGAHVLLEDLSETHDQTERPLPPAREHCQQAVECLGRVHAHWWESPGLELEVASLQSDACVERQARDLERLYGEFRTFLEDRLSPIRRRLFDRAIREVPVAYRRRLTSGRALTRIHGSAHAWNFLFPRQNGLPDTRIIDWTDWTTGLGTDDLAYFMALHWDRERRQVLEAELLRRYHSELARAGVNDYDWECCAADYRLSCQKTLLTPLYLFGNGVPADVWWPQVQHAAQAVEDWGGLSGS